MSFRNGSYQGRGTDLLGTLHTAADRAPLVGARTVLSHFSALKAAQALRSLCQPVSKAAGCESAGHSACVRSPAAAAQGRGASTGSDTGFCPWLCRTTLERRACH